MKISLLSGAVKNAGDYLIGERCKALMEFVYPNVMHHTYIRNFPLKQSEINEINRSDIVIVAGGPCYIKDLYPGHMPLVDDLAEIKVPIAAVGCGWNGRLTQDRDIWGYQFEKESVRLLDRISEDTEYLGCRDFYSLKILKTLGICGVMTGCPAWYNIKKVSDRLSLKEIKKIMISDPARNILFGNQSIAIVKYLCNRFPEATIEYVFHRGIAADKYTDEDSGTALQNIRNQLDELGIQWHDISYGSEGFLLYRDCDLHIGHRVHAHIYNLSERHCSILMEEDARGAGVNETLGLWGIKAYSEEMRCNQGKHEIYKAPNKYVLQNLDSYLDFIFDDKGVIFNAAFSKMEHYFEKMLNHLSGLEKYI